MEQRGPRLVPSSAKTVPSRRMASSGRPPASPRQPLHGLRQVGRGQCDADTGTATQQGGEPRERGRLDVGIEHHEGAGRVDGEERAGHRRALRTSGRADDDDGHAALDEQPREPGQARVKDACPQQGEDAQRSHHDSIGQASNRGLTAVIR